MRRWSFTLVFFLACSGVIAGDSSQPQLHAPEPRLKSIYSEVHQIGEFKKPDTRAVVCIFVGTHCPVVQQYMPRLKEIHAAYARQGVKLLAIYSNVGDNVLSMALHAQDMDIPFPVFLDYEHRLADLYQVERTPEVVVLDGNLKKRYQGAIDNQFKKRGNTDAATEDYLENAITEVLAGRQVEPDHVLASGCRIERREPLGIEGPASFHKDVEPLLQKHCQACHRPGEVGPFSLLSYKDAYNNADMIEEVVSERRMPPWHGILNPEFGELLNDKRLSDEEVATIVGWVRGGAKEGSPKDAPAAITWPAHGAWGMGKPDFVYKMPKPFQVPASGTLEYQFVRVPLNFPADRWLRASEVKPGNSSVVHHIGLHVVESGDKDYSGFAGTAALFGFSGESSHELNDYVPGDPYNQKVYPSHQAVRIPKHSDLVFEIHYTPTGKAASDQSMVAVRWTSAPQEEILTRVFRKTRGGFRIPPYDPHFRMEDSYYFPQDVEIDAIRPHFHARGKSFRVELIQRNPQTDEIETRQTVLSVPVFDFRWQRTYELKTPLHVPAGMELLTTAHFDNSALNPNNPDPSAVVVWGLQSSDEMFSTRFRYRLAKETK